MPCKTPPKAFIAASSGMSCSTSSPLPPGPVARYQRSNSAKLSSPSWFTSYVSKTWSVVCTASSSGERSAGGVSELAYATRKTARKYRAISSASMWPSPSSSNKSNAARALSRLAEAPQTTCRPAPTSANAMVPSPSTSKASKSALVAATAVARLRNGRSAAKSALAETWPLWSSQPPRRPTTMSTGTRTSAAASTSREPFPASSASASPSSSSVGLSALQYQSRRVSTWRARSRGVAVS
mmetsp:Transcript_8983/g.29687  ORF Transcript_8983/g.29687 Transcript_8983/m.29687 type:complete len:240 (-) Transcript_8983:407-1126(-)